MKASLTYLALVVVPFAVLGCGTTPPTTTSDLRQATASYDAGDDSLGFDLPGDFGPYVPLRSARVSPRQDQAAEQVLASASLTGFDGPEVKDGERTVVDLTFDLRGRGDVTITKWRVKVRHQTSGEENTQEKEIDTRINKAIILFDNLPVGRYDAEVSMYGTTDQPSTGTGTLVFDLDIKKDDT